VRPAGRHAKEVEKAVQPVRPSAIRWVNGEALYRAAWVVSLGPWIGASLYLWARSDYHLLSVFFVQAFFLLLVLPAFSVWGSRPLGGAIIIGWGAFHIYRLCSSPIDWHELDFVASLAAIPFWAVFIAGGFLHIVAWWQERRNSRVLRRT
jgi:hypothetical protein